MIKIFITLFSLLLATAASAAPYGNYDPKRLLTAVDTPSGKKPAIDGKYLDQMVNDLAAHAKNYPPQFDSPQDQQRAAKDAQVLAGMLDLMIDGPGPNPELLIRAAFLNAIGHNLDVPGAAEKADKNFQKYLALVPSDPRGNYMYGTFLGGVGKPKDALPYLEKALSYGVIDAAYAKGMSHLALGEKDQALKSFDIYKRQRPSDPNVDKLIDAIKNGQIEVKRTPG
jgi:tetratricopeptide (TPR) repeat protein